MKFGAAVNPDLATLIALLGEAVNNDHAAKNARGRKMREDRLRKNQRMRAANRRMRGELTRDKRLAYEAWVERCKRLRVHITTQERFDFLSELSHIRRAAA